jgi:hypothetical protein
VSSRRSQVHAARGLGLVATLGASAVCRSHPIWGRTRICTHSASPFVFTFRAADNRMVAFPYPKRLCAIMDVDQSAAVRCMPPGRFALHVV